MPLILFTWSTFKLLPSSTSLLRLCLFFLPNCSSLRSADYAVEERPSEIVLMQQLEEGGPDPLVFVLNANLLAMVKLVNCESSFKPLSL